MENHIQNITNERSYIKSISLKLAPVGNTAETIKNRKYIERDTMLRETAYEVLPAIDDFIIDIANRTFNKVDVNEIASLLYEKDEAGQSIYTTDAIANEEAISAIGKVSKKEIEDITSPFAEKKIKGPEDLASANFLFEILPEYIKQKKEVPYDRAFMLEKLSSLKGCAPIFKTLLVSRVTAISSSLPKRYVENLGRYISNIAAIEAAMKSPLHDEIVKNFGDYTAYARLENYALSADKNGIEKYNVLISGVSSERGTVKKGFNMLVKEYNSQNKTARLSMMKPLYKQILVKGEKAFSIPFIDSDEDLLGVLSGLKEMMPEFISRASLLMDSVTEDELFFAGRDIHNLSFIVTGNHQSIPDKIYADALDDVNARYAGTTKKTEIARRDKEIESLQNVINKKIFCAKDLKQYADGYDILLLLRGNLKERITTHNNATRSLEKRNLSESKIRSNEKNVTVIKKYLESAIEIRRFVSLVRIAELENNSEFYNDVATLLSDMYPVVSAMNMARNYCTKTLKERARKTQISFGTPANLSSKWYTGDEKLSKGVSTIVKIDEEYFFFTLADTTKPIQFIEEKNPTAYVFSQKKAAKAYQTLPKIAFNVSGAKSFFEDPKNKEQNVFVIKYEKMREPVTVTRTQYEIKKSGTFTTAAIKKKLVSEEGFRANIEQMILLYNRIIKSYTEFDRFHFDRLKEPSKYANIQDYFDDIDACTTSMDWLGVSRAEIEGLVESGAALMFKITNRHMKTGQNLDKFAKSFLHIFSKENFENINMRLNGSPSVYFRPAIKERTVTHKKGSILVNYVDKNGNPIPSGIYNELYHFFNGNITEVELTNEAKAMKASAVTKVATHDYVRDKRYTKGMFSIAFSYTGNYQKGKSEKNSDTDTRIDEAIGESGNILTVIRGVTHPLYVQIEDANGRVLHTEYMDVINGFNYAQKLKNITWEKENAKANWTYDNEIASFKEGYIKAGVSRICHLAIEYSAVIVIENIDTNFKNKHIAIDNQLFAKFAEKLRSSLSEYTDKYIDAKAPGGIANPLQLSHDLFGYRAGLIYEISPAYTASMDYDTGFVPLFDMKQYGTIKEQRNFLGKFKRIWCEDGAFRFTFCYKDFRVKSGKKDLDSSILNREWTVKVSGERTYYNKVTKKIEYTANIAKELLELLKAYDVKKNLAETAKTMKQQEVSQLFKALHTAVYGTVDACKEVSQKYHVSPITGKKSNTYALSAHNLAEKYRYLKTEDVKSESWICYKQSNKQA